MNAMNLALAAYSTSAAPARTPRTTEYEAFARITRLMQSANSAASNPFADRARAIHENRRLWNILATDVASEGNTLPRELRAQIFYLAEFTDLHSRKVLKQNADLQPLIDINTAIMRGLRNGEVT